MLEHSSPPSSKKPGVWRFRWQLGLLLLFGFLPIGIGLPALQSLLRNSELSDCDLVSAETEPSLRFYCAQLLSSERTPDSLSRALHLVGNLPADHPLRSESDRLVQQWSLELLSLSEDAFQQGKLSEAMTNARQAKTNPQLSQLIDQRLAHWQKVWSSAESVYQQAQNELQASRWQEAFAIAKQLQQIGNDYWETTRYQELMQQVQATREENDWQARLTEKQRSLTGRDVLDRWRQQRETDELARLEQARKLASSGKAEDLRAAISTAIRVSSSSPRYEETRQLLAVWNQELETLEDRSYLDSATQIAQQGDSTSLQAAINEASRIYRGRALYGEAQGRIEQWSRQLQQAQTAPQEVRHPTSEPMIDPEPSLSPGAPASEPLPIR